MSACGLIALEIMEFQDLREVGQIVLANKQVSLQRAQIAADAAALAAATNGDNAAAYFAEHNGADLVSLRRFGVDDEFVEIIANVNGMRAIAIATTASSS